MSTQTEYSWGPPLWKSLHYIALGMPDSPSSVDKANYATFYNTLHTVIPCGVCANHYEEMLRDYPVHDHVGSANDLFAWTVRIHNMVNERLGKKTWGVEDAKELYTTGGGVVDTNPTSNMFMLLLAVALLGVVLLCAVCLHMMRHRINT